MRKNGLSEAEIVCELLSIETEEKKRFSALQNYNVGEKIHYKQIAFHKNPAKNRWVFGGNRSGKTECGAVECIYMARGIHPYRENRRDVTGWVVSLSTQVQRDVAQKKILSYLSPRDIVEITMLQGKKGSPSQGVIDQIVVRNELGGTSTIGFKSCDQGREKFQGTSLDFVWFDEEPPEDIYEECRMRVFDKCGDLFGTMTPLKGLSWVYDKIYCQSTIDPSIWCEFMEWADNPHLDEKSIELLSKTLDKSTLKSRRYGHFQASEGLVYTEFDENIHVIAPFDFPAEWQDNISIDPGLHNPLSCHFYAVDYDGNVYVVAEHYSANLDVHTHAKKINEIANALHWKRNSNGMLESLIDSAATARTLSSEKNVVDLFYDNGILTNPKVNKDVFSGINRVKAYLKDADGEARLFIFSTCTNLIREFKRYWWGKDETPIKKDDHALDELRYYIASKPEIPRLPEKKSEIAKDKERLYNRLKRQQRFNYQ